MHRLRSDAGESLLEVLVTIVILGLASVALLGAIGTAVNLSGDQRGSAEALVVVGRAAEAVKAQGTGGAACESLAPESFGPAIDALADLPPGWSTTDIAVTSVTCVPVDSTTLPHVTVTATSPNDETASLVVVPRRGA